MEFTLWFIIIGAIFVLMALSSSLLKRLPLTTSLLYLLVGFGLGSFGLGLIKLDPLTQSPLLERLTEVAVAVSLFTTGLKLHIPLSEGRWKLPVRLAFGSMIITVGLIAFVGVYWLGLSIGAAILLGAILAPTDPVLASDVQVADALDRDRLRFGLSGEAGLNDGSAFPFMMLGLGLLGLHEIGVAGWQWLAVDVGWSVVGGLGVGGLLGTLIGRLVIYLRQHHREAIGLDDFLTLGLIALTYGLAVLIGASGFLAVFAAGLALRRIERLTSGDKAVEEVLQEATLLKKEEVAAHPEQAAAFMTEAVLGFNEQLERIGEVIVVLLLGGMLSFIFGYFAFEVIWFIPLLFLVIRPVSVWLGLLGSRATPLQRYLISWFGIRGIGSVNYLMYSIEHGLPHDLAQRLTSITLTVVAVSIVVHGISVTPLMNFYGVQMKRRQHRQRQREASKASLPQ